MITLHCIVWAAILFPAHPYIESATALSDRLVTLIQLVTPFDQFVVSSLYKDLVVPQRLKFLEQL